MRLAQEQDIGGGVTEINKRNLQIHDLKRQTALRLAQEQGQSRAAVQSSNEGVMQILPPEQGTMQYQHPYGVPLSFSPVESNRVPQDSGMFNHQAAENRSFQRYEGHGMVTNTNMTPPNHRTQYVQSRTNLGTVPNVSQFVVRFVLLVLLQVLISYRIHLLIQLFQHGFDRSSQRTPMNNRPGSSLSTGSANSFGSGSVERKGKEKPKLPHGLTVQELKEMTKARLQAEAAEGVIDGDSIQPSNVALPHQPYGRGNGEGVSPLGFVHDQCANSYPHARNQVMAPGMHLGSISPHQPHMMMAGRDGNFQPRDSWQQSSGLDGWESASVASTANSDYLGSDSPYSSGFQQQDDFSGVPFLRSRSYGGGYDQQESRATPYFVSSSPFAELTPGQNRRRASTLSPRPGPGLTYLHEDRPLGSAATAGGLPSFDSSSQPLPRIRTINSDSFNETGSQSSSPARFWTGPSGGVIGDGLSNRPRTASAPTVRLVSQPSDEIKRGGHDPLARLPSSHSLGLGGEGAFDSALGLSTTGSVEDRGTEDLSSVFRQPTAPPRPPPGLFPNSESSGPGWLGVSRSNDLGFDDGWGKPSIGFRDQEYQSRERAHTDGEALLADSLGSMLNISANREASLGHNTFVSRIDPEVDFNRRRAATSSPVSPSYGIYDALSAPDCALFERGALRDDKSRYM